MSHKQQYTLISLCSILQYATKISITKNSFKYIYGSLFYFNAIFKIPNDYLYWVCSHIYIYIHNTVKSVYKGHSREPENLPFMSIYHRRSWHGPTAPPFFSNFLFTNLFSLKFLYFFIISSLFPCFNLFVSIFIQSYVNNNFHVSTI